MSASNASNFKRLVLESTNKDKTVDISAGTVSIDYYEDIFSPTVTAKVAVINTGESIEGEDGKMQSLYNGLPLRGGERLRMEIVDQGTGNGQELKKGLDFGSSQEKYLYVSSITNVMAESRRESFILNLISREAIANETTRVEKRYDKKIHDTVKLILKDVLKSNNFSEDNIHSSKHSYSFIGNMKKPFTILVWLASKCVPDTSQGDSTAGFLFYQTQDGFNFKSIDKLIDTEPKATYTYTEVASNISDFNIISYFTDKNQNLIQKLRLGTYSSQRIFFNPANFTFTDRRKGKFQMDPDKMINLGTNGKITLPKVTDNSPQLLSDIPTRILSGVIDVGVVEKGISTSVNADPSHNQAQSIMRYNLLMTQTISMTVPCNTDLRAGDIINCRFPKISQDGERGSEDEETSGLYMIKELCHHFEPTSSFTSMTLVRDNFGRHKK